MEFKEFFKNDLDHIGCTLSDLSKASGLSSAVLSRYRSGERVPRRDSEILVQLCDGLTKLESENSSGPVVRERLELYRSILSEDSLLLSEHFDALLKSLRVSMKDLSRDLNYDASYLSRIRSGKRSPSDPEAFAAHVSHVILDRAQPNELSAIRDLITADPSEPVEEQLKRWLIQKEHQQTAEISSFLTKLDDFDLDQYIRLMNFDDLSSLGPAPAIDDYAAYYGADEMSTSELDFLRTVLASGGQGTLFMCTDMPLHSMDGNMDFVKHWMTLITACLKNGMHVNVIHDVDRPFSEMLLGIEGWIPIYMTGEVSPFYLPEERSTVYRHCLNVSDHAVLAGECIQNDYEHGRCTISTLPKDIEYAKTRADAILKLAKPLIKIYRRDGIAEHQELWNAESEAPGNRTIMACNPPIFTLTGDLLAAILEEAGVPEEDRVFIENFRKSELNYVNNMLRHGTIDMRIPLIPKAEFNAHVPTLFLTQLFRNYSIPYTWKTFQKHIRLTREFAETTPGFSFREDEEMLVRNISIYTRNDRFAAVMKSGSPEISFIITNPKLVKAIRNFSAPLSE